MEAKGENILKGGEKKNILPIPTTLWIYAIIVKRWAANDDDDAAAIDVVKYFQNLMSPTSIPGCGIRNLSVVKKSPIYFYGLRQYRIKAWYVTYTFE